MMNRIGRMMIRPYAFGDSRMLIAQSGVAGTALTGGTGETTLDTVNISAGLLGPNGRVDFFFGGFHVGAAGTKTWRMKLGGTTLVSVVMATNSGTPFHCYGTIFAVNSQSSERCLYISNRTTDGLISTNVETTAAIDMSAATTITITGQLSNAADSMQRTGYLFDVTRA